MFLVTWRYLFTLFIPWLFLYYQQQLDIVFLFCFWFLVFFFFHFPHYFVDCCEICYKHSWATEEKLYHLDLLEYLSLSVNTFMIVFNCVLCYKIKKKKCSVTVTQQILFSFLFSYSTHHPMAVISCYHHHRWPSRCSLHMLATLVGHYHATILFGLSKKNPLVVRFRHKNKIRLRGTGCGVGKNTGRWVVFVLVRMCGFSGFIALVLFCFSTVSYKEDRTRLR